VMARFTATRSAFARVRNDGFRRTQREDD
jgi:hypothetical protein